MPKQCTTKKQPEQGKYIDKECPLCGKRLNTWDVRVCKALGYKNTTVCEECVAKEYDKTVEEFRSVMEAHFGMRPCMGL